MKRTLTLSVKDDKGISTYEVKTPNVGEYMRIQSLKSIYSNNSYKGMEMSSNTAMHHALDLVDMCANMTVLCPDYISKLPKDQDGNRINLMDVDIFDIQPTLDAYKEQFVPWMKEIEKILRQNNA